MLVNDFGELPIDADLIEAREGNLISISGGCICCSFGSDLIAAIMELRAGAPADRSSPDRNQRRCAAGLDRAVAAAASPISTSTASSALPMPKPSGNAPRDRYMSDTVLAQLAASDIIVLNKIDLVSPEQLAATRSWLNEVAPRARVLPAQNASLPPDLILTRQDGRQTGRFFASGHDTTRMLATVSFEITGNGDPEALAQALADPRLHLLRAKGLVRDRHGTLTAIHVMGLRSSVAPAPPMTSGPGRLVCIGLTHDMHIEAITGAIAACPPFSSTMS